ncbi:MAG: formylmethanofuran dehydrogenase subunit B [Halobacteriota archaeon]
MAENENENDKILEAVVCPFCACLCDDLVISVDIAKNRIKEIRNACTVGVEKFHALHKEGRVRKTRIDGKETDYDTAIEKALDILKAAKKPLIYGLSNSGYNAQRVALEIAKRKRGVFDFPESIYHALLYRELRKGKNNFYFALLDEIRDNANVVIYWGANPIEVHPRHLSRYSVYPAGRYALRGVMDRELITIDVADSELKEISRWYLPVKPGDARKLAEVMTQLIKGEPNVLREPIADGIDFDDITKLAARLKKAFYGVIFLGYDVLLSHEAGSEFVEAIFALVDALNNAGAKFVLFPMNGHFNVMGTVQLLLRETGYPSAVDFSRDRMLEHDNRTADVLDEIDAALIVGADSSFTKEEAKRLCDVPVILIDPFETLTTLVSSVVFPAAVTGVEAEEVAYRMDGLPLKLDKILDCEYQSEKEILERIYKGLVEKK